MYLFCTTSLISFHMLYRKEFHRKPIKLFNCNLELSIINILCITFRSFSILKLFLIYCIWGTASFDRRTSSWDMFSKSCCRCMFFNKVSSNIFCILETSCLCTESFWLSRLTNLSSLSTKVFTLSDDGVVGTDLCNEEIIFSKRLTFQRKPVGCTFSSSVHTILLD